MTDLHEAALAVQAKEDGIANLRNALNTYEAAQGLASEMHALEQLQIAARPEVLRVLLDFYCGHRDRRFSGHGRTSTAYDDQFAMADHPFTTEGTLADAGIIEAGDTEGGSCD